MVIFVTNCYAYLGVVGVIAYLLCNRGFLEMFLLFNYINVELKMQLCFCMYVSTTFLEHFCDILSCLWTYEKVRKMPSCLRNKWPCDIILSQ